MASMDDQPGTHPGAYRFRAWVLKQPTQGVAMSGNDNVHPPSFLLGIVVGGAVTLILTAMLCAVTNRRDFEQEAVKRGHGHYNEKTAVFQWNAVPNEVPAENPR